MVTAHVTPTNINFELKNHENVPYRLENLMGEHGMLLGFTGDVWQVSCVRYVLWLQRQSFKLSTYGINSALIVPNQTYELNGFFMSIPRDIPFPLLADPNASVYETVGMEKPGYMLFNRDGDILGRWYVNDTASLSLKSVMYRFR